MLGDDLGLPLIKLVMGRRSQAVARRSMVAVWVIFWMMVLLQIVLFLVDLELQANFVRSSQLITSKEVSPTRALVPHIAIHVI